MLNDDLQKFGIKMDDSGVPSAGSSRPQDLAPILYSVTEIFHQLFPNGGGPFAAVIRDLTGLRTAFESGNPDDADVWRQDVAGHLLDVQQIVDKEFTPEQRNAFVDDYQRLVREGSAAYDKSPVKAYTQGTGLLDQLNDERVKRPVLDALSQTEIAQFNAKARANLSRNGLRIDLDRTSGPSLFYTWLVAEQGMSIDQVYDLSSLGKDRIHDLFVDFNKYMDTHFTSINPDAAATMGRLQSRFLDAVADAHMPDIDPRNPDQVRAAMDKAQFLNEIMLDWQQDYPTLTGISAAYGRQDFDPAQSAAFYKGAGGKESYESRLTAMHGKVNGLTTLFSSHFPKADEPGEMATRIDWFRKDYQKFRGKRLGDVRTPGLKMQEKVSESLSRDYLSHQAYGTPQPTDQAIAYLSGNIDSLPWHLDADLRIAEIQRDARMHQNNEVSVAGYNLSVRSFDPQQINSFLPPAGTDITKLSDEQRSAALDKASLGFLTAFGKSFDPKALQPLFSAGKDSFDAIRIDGRTVRELADQELAGQAWAQPSVPGGSAAREQYMQMMVLKGMTDPDRRVTLTLGQLDEQDRLRDMPPYELSAPVKELRIGPADQAYRQVDLGEASRNLLVEGPVTGLNEEIRALASAFAPVWESGIPQSQKDALKRWNKDIYDTVFINGKSVNDLFRETYGNSFDQRPQAAVVLKDALITAHRMSPDAQIDMWRVDENADTFTLSDEAVAIGVRDDVIGLDGREKQRIAALNRELVQKDPAERRLAADKQPSAGDIPLDRLRQIDEVYAKMESEKQGRHRNSKEYQDMKNAVYAVHLAMAEYHPDDPQSRADMSRLVDRVKETSSEYARLKAYGKTKMTEMGVQRKNTALALMDITGAQIQEDRVIDRRQTKAESKKTRKSLRDLLRDEHETTRTTHGAEATQRRKQRRHAEAEKRKHMGQSGPTAPTGN
ncbi:MAG: hypothetical protein K6G16_11325 [Lachnospiraceae bacterium]|nr:hypothetical protein [Lachnospiraceae bacterium]